MKKKLLFLVPALLGLFLSACNTGSGDSSPSPVTPSSGNTEPGGGDSETTKYTITFKDEIGNILESKKWDEGVVPSYNYTKVDTAEWDYTFNGWSLSLGGEVITIPAVSADATYFANVSKVKKSYNVSFYDENGTQIKSELLEYGSQPECDYVGPSDTAEWDYSFQGWATSQHGSPLASIPTVTQEVSYYAIINSTKQTYTVSWCENNGSLIESSILPYGTIPSRSYETASSMEWDYTFLGWAPTPNGTPLTSLPLVTGNATYYAQVSKVKKQYTVTFESNGGTSVTSITEDYGTEIAKPTDPEKSGYHLTGWSTDPSGQNIVTWPLTLVDNIKLYAQWNEVIDIKSYFQTLLSIVGHDPYSYIPSSLRPDNSVNHVTAEAVNYDFTQFNDVSSIKYGGHGEQWHMVTDNIKESERFYSVLSIGEAAMNASVVIFNNYLDNNPGTTASHSINETAYTASIDFHAGVLKYSIQYKTNLNIPFFGEVTPQVDMEYNILSLQKSVRIQLTENNAMKYVVTDNAYTFGIQYGVENVSRKAYFNIERAQDESITGHIYEFVQYKDKDLVPSCADFYINDEYTSVVGNKASGIPGFAGYINELYETNAGKLIGYKVRETFTKWGFEKTYNTLWFNLNNIQNINTVKAIDNGGVDPHENNHDVYLNNSDTIFAPAKNKLIVETSRKYDVEMRKQYFYGYNEGELTEYETNIPMMFIQDDGDKSGETNYSTFENDILSKNGIAASVSLASKYLTKIRADYLSLIDTFIENKDDITGEMISSFIGSANAIQ